MAKDLATFLRIHDPKINKRLKISKALTSLGAAWEYPTEFAKRAGVGVRILAEMQSDFPKHVVMTHDPRQGRSRALWAGTPRIR
jgi:hypothetical protein